MFDMLTEKELNKELHPDKEKEIFDGDGVIAEPKGEDDAIEISKVEEDTIIEENDNKAPEELYKELITSESLSFSAAYDNVYNKLDNIYKYNLFYDNNDDTLIRNTLFGVKMRVQFELNNLLYLTEVVMEVGDINE